MKITLIGLGITAGDLTLRAKCALDSAKCIIARTAQAQSFKSLDGYNVETLDFLYEKSRNFDTLNKKLAQTVLDRAKSVDVCYCVDGAVWEDEGCKIILAKHKNCEVLDSVSKSAHTYNTARLNKSGVTFVSAYSVKELKFCRAVCVYDIDSDLIAGEVKEKLSYIFGEETDCAFVSGGRAKSIKIYEIDRQKTYDTTCAVAVEEREFLKRERYDFADLEEMIRILRAPDGCPWDRAQTSESIKKNMIEEAYELVDAIERGDLDGMEEETGDVLLQAAFHSVMSEEKGEYTGGDALTRVIKKLIFRHSHIFGKDKAASASDALGVWEKNKMTEKGETTYGESVQAVPKNLPSCMYAQKVGKRAAKSGMDFLSPLSASEQMVDEVKELMEALFAEDKQAIFDEAGDVLFSAVNTCRLAGVDCEEALKSATNKFANRFIKCEQLIISDGKDITELDDEELNLYWVRAKNELKAN